MRKRLFRPPNNLIKEWPEVFNDLYMNTIPVVYTINMILEFKDGTIWEIDIQNQLGNINADLFSKRLLGVLEEYSPTIKRINFRFDIDKLKKDIKSSTENIL